MTSKLRVVIAEDHYLVREGVRRALEESDRLVVVATVSSAAELEAIVERDEIDVVVTDIRMPPDHHMEGIDAAHRIRTGRPDVGVVVLSQYADAAYAMALLGHGTDGLAYLLKERVGDPEQLIAAVHAVADGGSMIDPDVVAALVARNAQQSESSLHMLTERELDVLGQMAQGRTNAGIAADLHLSESSIEKYATSIFSKLGLTDEPLVHRRVAAVLTYLHRSGQARPL